MKPHYKRLLGAALFIFSVFTAGSIIKKPMNTKLASTPTNPLRVVFPFSILSAKERLVDPSNLETIYEYYLLENLGLGLLRDDSEQFEDYKVGFAQRWTQVDSKTWSFELVQNARWSDGSPITGEDWVLHFNTLKLNTSRHLIHLHNLEDVNFTQASNTLTLRFSQPTSNTLLHELSLSDAVLVNQKNLTGDWSITSGPYSVKELNWAKKSLLLASNPHCPLSSEASPKFVELFSVQKFNDVGLLFKEIRADIYSLPTLSYDPAYKSAEANAPAMVIGDPTSISLFNFGKSHPLTKSFQARMEFRTLVREALHKGSFRNAKFEEQLIPTGYAGRLLQLDIPSVEIHELRGRTLKINLFPGYKSIPEFAEALKTEALKHDINLEVIYGTPNNIENSDALFAALSIFKGNQKDAIGSWSFLFSENGQLAPFRSEEISELNRITSVSDFNLRTEALKSLHKRVLEKAYAVPFRIEATRVLLSKEVNVSKWNPFDMRLRLYDVRIK